MGKGVLIFFGLILLLVLVGVSQSHGTRCREAGYKGAEFEDCIMRVTKGKPVYLENMGKSYD